MTYKGKHIMSLLRNIVLYDIASAPNTLSIAIIKNVTLYPGNEHFAIFQKNKHRTNVTSVSGHIF